jgi:mediator of RNA polymerase II transcription subunit 14
MISRSVLPSSHGHPRVPPPAGGTLTISIVETAVSVRESEGPRRSSKAKVIAKLQHKFKLGNAIPSDVVEGLRFEIRWEVTKDAFGVIIPAEDIVLPEDTLHIVCVTFLIVVES